MSGTVTISWADGWKLEAERPGFFSHLLNNSLAIDPGERVYVGAGVIEKAIKEWGTFRPPATHNLLRDGGFVSPVFNAIPRKDWPLWANAIAENENDDDKGVGDTVLRMIGSTESTLFKTWHLATFGTTCNCDRRREQWNILYPYPRGK